VSQIPFPASEKTLAENTGFSQDATHPMKGFSRGQIQFVANEFFQTFSSFSSTMDNSSLREPVCAVVYPKRMLQGATFVRSATRLAVRCARTSYIVHHAPWTLVYESMHTWIFIDDSMIRRLKHEREMDTLHAYAKCLSCKSIWPYEKELANGRQCKDGASFRQAVRKLCLHRIALHHAWRWSEIPSTSHSY